MVCFSRNEEEINKQPPTRGDEYLRPDAQTLPEAFVPSLAYACGVYPKS